MTRALPGKLLEHLPEPVGMAQDWVSTPCQGIRGSPMSRMFGAVTENGYVVRDIAAAMRHWIEVIGVGPWFYVERAPIEDFRYQG